MRNLLKDNINPIVNYRNRAIIMVHMKSCSVPFGSCFLPVLYSLTFFVPINFIFMLFKSIRDYVLSVFCRGQGPYISAVEERNDVLKACKI